ncbi:MAG: PAC2 family protein, partial [Proteobacteria bacterium]|nr:PAC2 family protein [Pseudomonadota bacterium]
SNYEFSDKILDMIQKFKGKEVITLGGIGLAEVPKKPKVYCTGNTKKIIKKYKNGMVDDKLYGVVGPIVGVSGLLIGLAKRRKIDAISFLAETYGHPMYLGIKGSIEVLKVLDKELKLNISMKRLNKEIKEIESDLLQKTEQISEVARQTALKKLKSKFGEDVDYIG